MDAELEREQVALARSMRKALSKIRARDPELYDQTEKQWRMRLDQERRSLDVLKEREMLIEHAERMARRRVLTK